MYQVTTKTATITLTTIDFIQSDLDYQTRTDPSVNPRASDFIAPYTNGAQYDPMTFLNCYKVDMAGGLASKSYTFAPSTDGSEMWFGMDWQCIFRKDMWGKIPRLELDDKVMLADAVHNWSDTNPPREQINESHQWNATTQQWQYDPDGKGWVDIGFRPVTPMQLAEGGKAPFNEIRFRWWWNGQHLDKGRWSSLQMAQNKEVYNLPDKFKNLPLIAERWGGPIRHPQIQTEGSLAAGATSDWHAFELMRGRLLHGTQPIPIDLPWAPV